MDQKWTKAKIAEINASKYPWGILGFFIILTAIGFFVSVVLFFAFNGKLSIANSQIKNQRHSITSLQKNVEAMKSRTKSLMSEREDLLSEIRRNKKLISDCETKLEDFSKTGDDASSPDIGLDVPTIGD
jgi:peptidoglycan hydrolase CwlO-like protein